VSAPDFVAIGHVTLDRFADAVRPGGAALYAAITAHRLGVSAGILTSHADDFPLDAIPPQIEIVSVPSARTTTFVHSMRPGRERRLIVTDTAAPLGPADVPDDWCDSPLVVLAPVLGEVDPQLPAAFPEAALGASAQGWLRSRDADGTIRPARWVDADAVIARIQALFVSDEDIRDDPAGVIDLFQHLPVGAITAGSRGAMLFVNSQRYEVSPYPVREVDPTGAGDVFAAAFLLRYERDGDPWAAAAAAACAAALSVEGEGFSAVPDTVRLEAALAEYHRVLGQTP
jgi:sugar/nucleoside kinase (ribokinase family)